MSRTKNNITTIICDVLVIGGGGAGLRAAIEAAKQKVKVLIVIKEPLGQAHTSMAAGGLNVAIKPPATPKQHYEDTIKGGWNINNYRLVKIFTREMPDRIYDLESYGVKFDKLPDGGFYTWAGGKQSAPLNLCAGDYTGREFMRGLKTEVKRLNIPNLPNHFVTKLLTSNGLVVGAFVIDKKTGKYKAILARAIIVATGGAGQLYLITSNAPANTGEGYAWGLDVGAKMLDMEFVQFHPTGMAFPKRLRGTLVTEKVRGHGGKLLNKNSERFMERYQPERLELAGRDEVTRAIYNEIQEGRGTKHDGVYLDITHWGKGVAQNLIPDVFKTYKKVGIDIRKTKMEVAPTMHHMMGGFKINQWGETNIPGLFACGEVTASIHGANRLGGNSLGEGQVFGRRTGLRAARSSRVMPNSFRHLEILNQVQDDIMEEVNRIESLKNRKSGLKPQALLRSLKQLMWDCAGIIRNEKGLKKGLRQLKLLQKSVKKLVARNKKGLQACLELIEMIKVAQMIFIAALIRKESRGAHYRSDFPKMKKVWEKNIVLQKKNGKIIVRSTPVVK